MGLHKKAAKGVFWKLLEQFGNTGISGIVTIILARFLVPEDFGLIAMLSIVIQLANSIMDSGFRQAIIQKKDTNQVDYCTVFYTNIILGIFSYLVLFLSAPMIAGFYHEPRLISLIRIIGITIIINSFRIIQVALLSKRLNFKPLVLASLPGSLFSGVIAVVFAKIGFGVWALAIQMLLTAFITTAILWITYGWHPSLAFSTKSFKSLFAFGSKLFLSGVLDIIFQNIYVIVIAKVFSAQEAGYYFFAFKLRRLIIQQLTIAVQKVTFPALVSIQENQLKIKEGFRQLMRTLTFFVFPIGLFAIALANPFFKVFLSDSWLPAVPIMQLMLFASLLLPVHSVNLNILMVKGRSDLFLYLEIVKKIFTVIILTTSIKYGIYGILYGQIINSILGYFLNSLFANKLVRYSIREQLSDILNSLGLSVLISLGIFIGVTYIPLNDILKITIWGSVGAFLYIIIAIIFRYEPVKMMKNIFILRDGRN